MNLPSWITVLCKSKPVVSPSNASLSHCLVAPCLDTKEQNHKCMQFLRAALLMPGSEWQLWREEHIGALVRYWKSLCSQESKSEPATATTKRVKKKEYGQMSLYATCLIVRAWREQCPSLTLLLDTPTQQTRFVDAGMVWKRELETQPVEIQLLTCAHAYWQHTVGTKQHILSRSLRTYLYRTAVALHHSNFPLSVRLRGTWLLYTQWIRAHGPPAPTSTATDNDTSVSTNTNMSVLVQWLKKGWLYTKELPGGVWTDACSWSVQCLVETFLLRQPPVMLTEEDDDHQHDEHNNEYTKTNHDDTSKINLVPLYGFLNRVRAETDTWYSNTQDDKDDTTSTSNCWSLLAPEIWSPSVVQLIVSQDHQQSRSAMSVPFRTLGPILLTIIQHLWTLLLLESIDSRTVSPSTYWEWIKTELLFVFVSALYSCEVNKSDKSPIVLGSEITRHLWYTVLGQPSNACPSYNNKMLVNYDTKEISMKHALLQMAELVHLHSITTVAQMKRSVLLFLFLVQQYTRERISRSSSSLLPTKKSKPTTHNTTTTTKK